MKFTMVKETDGKLPFLDILVVKDDNHLHASVYRKPSFTGLGTSLFSYLPKSLKFSAIPFAMHRAYHLSSTYMSFHRQLTFLEQFFHDNGFATGTVRSFIRKFLDSISL